MSSPTPAQARYTAALTDAIRVAEHLDETGQSDRLAGLAVAVDLGVSAAFLFTLDDHAYDDAARVVRAAIESACEETI